MSQDSIESPTAPPTAAPGLELDLLRELDDGRPLPGRDRVTTGTTYVLLGVLALGLAFLGGAWFERNHGPKPTTAASTAAVVNPFAAAGAAGASSTAAGRTGTNGAAANGATGSAPTGANGVGAGGFGGAGAGGFGGGTTGEVKLVDGTNLYIVDASGHTVKVSTTASTPVTVTKTGTVADLAAGEQVVVIGQTNADGSITATQIRGGTGAAIGGGRTQGGQAGGQTPAQSGS